MFKRLFEFIKNKGVMISYSTGKPFDPRNQKRTDPMQDIVKGGKDGNKFHNKTHTGKDT